MATPIEENRPIPVSRKGGKPPRRISQRERRRQAFQYWVTVALAVVFIGSSVGVMILARPMGAATQKQSNANASEQRLATAREQAQKNPNDPQFPYEIGGLLSDQGDMDGAVAQYKAALKIDPGYLPALQKVADILITQKKFQDAEKLLKDGVVAEAKDIEKLNKERKQDEPELTPDPMLRFFLFDCDMELGPEYKAEAQSAVKEGLAANPTNFVKYLQGWALTKTLQDKNKAQALAGLEIAQEAARAARDDESAAEIGKLMKMVISFQTQPTDLPSGVVMPGVAPSGAAVPAGASPNAAVPSAPNAAVPAPASGGPGAAPAVAAPAAPGAPNAVAPAGAPTAPNAAAPPATAPVVPNTAPAAGAPAPAPAGASGPAAAPNAPSAPGAPAAAVPPVGAPSGAPGAP